MALIRQIDIALGRYYYKLNITDYFDAKGNGRFQLWCNNNDYDESLILETLKEGDPTDDTMTYVNIFPIPITNTHVNTVLSEFDPLFPFQQTHTNEDAKNRKIFEILQKCANDSEAFKDNFVSYPPYTRKFLRIYFCPCHSTENDT